MNAHRALCHAMWHVFGSASVGKVALTGHSEKNMGEYLRSCLFQPRGTSEWWVSSSESAASCKAGGWINAPSNLCAASPEACAGRWLEPESTGCDSTWCDAPGLAVREAQCADVCGAHGSVANAETCECSCRDGFSGPQCELAPAYSISGAAKRSAGELNGIYTQVAGKLCNGKPVYQTSPGDYFLFQPSRTSQWWVSDGEDAASCKAIGWIHTPSNVCGASPDGCDGRWREVYGTCTKSWWTGSVSCDGGWHDATGLEVTPLVLPPSPPHYPPGTVNKVEHGDTIVWRLGRELHLPRRSRLQRGRRWQRL